MVILAPVDILAECLEGDCVNGKGTFIYPEDMKYVGDFKGGKPNGQGTLTLPGGDKYVGEFEDGEPVDSK